MIIEQLYTNCLAQGAYYISSNGEAAIIDPLRETKPYIELLKKNKTSLKYIFETHFHADFVSGHVDLAKATGASIVFGPNAETHYPSHIAQDGEEFKIGALTVQVLHTPGHTLESSCFLLLDENKKQIAVFTGDTLFIGDVGRPDLAVKSTLTEHDLAGMLYESLQKKIIPLNDSIIVYPAHGAGSACGKNMSKETFDTLGNQKKVNYALGHISKEEFITQLTSDILPAPQYFSKNAELNKIGYNPIDLVIKNGQAPLSVSDVKEKRKEKNTIILDVRKAEEFSESHIPNSLFIGIDGQFAPWVGTVIKDLHTNIILVCPIGREEETITRLARVGYDKCIGFLNGGFETWKNSGEPCEQIESIDAIAFSKQFNASQNIIDVRRPSEYATCHIENVPNMPLDFITAWAQNLNKNNTYFIHCAGGYRSMITASILKAEGLKNLIDIKGGFGKIKETSIKLKHAKTQQTL